MMSDEEQLVPKKNLDDALNNARILQQRADGYYEEVQQLRAALKSKDMFQRADDINQKQTVKLIIPTWQRAREIAMDLLHIKVGNDNIAVTIEYQGDKLNAIRPES